MLRLFLISHEHDGDEVAALSAGLRAVGVRAVVHNVRDGDLAAITPPAQSRQIVILWTSALIDHPAVETFAERMRGKARLIEGRLDDAMPSSGANEVLDFRHGYGGDPTQRFAALFAAVAPPKPRRSPPTWRFAVIGAAALAGVALAVYLHLGSAHAPPTSIAAASATQSAAEAQRPLALPPATREAASVAIGSDERADWRRLSQTTDSVSRLAAAQGFRALYPNSPFESEAAGIEAKERNRIAQAQSALQARGFDPGPANGVAHPETIAAVQAFQAWMRIPVDGQINDKLLAALGATDDAGRGAVPAATAAIAPPPGPQPAALAQPRIVRDCFLCPELVILPPMFGVIGDRGGNGLAAETPAFDAQIGYGLAVGRFEVTFEEWDACVADGGCPEVTAASGDRGPKPIRQVSLTQAKRFLAWLSRKTGRGYRLLSETEWEIYARAGTVTAYRGGDKIGDLCAARPVAAACGRSREVATVGAEQPNALGLSDMSGNVWEWVEDCWADTRTQAPHSGAPRITGCAPGLRVIRGGGFDSNAEELRLSFRRAARDEPFANVGFRVARPIDMRGR
jgi:hypothetical protein